VFSVYLLRLTIFGVFLYNESMSDPDSEVDVAALHQALIDELIEKEALTSDEVTAAFRAVPRHLFLPDEPLTAVYTDRPIVTKRDNGRAISSSSQPTMMAIMLEQLAVQPGEQVLEVGAGTGYNAALLGQIAGEDGRVTTIDLDADTAAAARSHLQTAGVENVQVVCGDGAAGFAENAPYDCLILTVGGWDITPDWLAQLKPDGRILLPLSLNGPQMSVLFARDNGCLHSTSIQPCGFMRLRGPHAEPETTVKLDPAENIQLSRMGGRSLEQIRADETYAWLMSEPVDLDTTVSVTRREIWSSLTLWLALHEPDLIFLEDVDVQETSPVPYLYSMVSVADKKKALSTVGLYTPEGMAFLMQPPSHSPFSEEEEAYKTKSFSLFVRGFGLEDTAVHRLRAHILAWEQAGRPAPDNLYIQVDPISNNHHPVRSSLIVKKKWHQFTLQWQGIP